MFHFKLTLVVLINFVSLTSWDLLECDSLNYELYHVLDFFWVCKHNFFLDFLCIK